MTNHAHALGDFDTAMIAATWLPCIKEITMEVQLFIPLLLLLNQASVKKVVRGLVSVLLEYSRDLISIIETLFVQKGMECFEVSIDRLDTFAAKYSHNGLAATSFIKHYFTNSEI